MKIVLDTNIFISAFFWGGHPRKVLERTIDGDDELYITDEIIEEIARVMSRPKFNIEVHIIDSFIRSIKEISQRVHIKGNVHNVCRDSEDDKILECALTVKADCIITGDNDLLVLKAYEGVHIITATAYLDLLKSIIPGST
ncbi:PIN domain-containing protein [Bacteroidia bacterium]|nr:PIN domain-containing protein [Bacteroidia bacterium]